MSHLNQQTLLLFATIIFVPAVFLHLTRKNTAAVYLYIIQSAAVALLLGLSAFDRFSPLLLVAIVATVAVKIFIAPYFFFGLIRRHELRFSVSTYLNTPVSLLVIAALLALTQSEFFETISVLAQSSEAATQPVFLDDPDLAVPDHQPQGRTIPDDRNTLTGKRHRGFCPVRRAGTEPRDCSWASPSTSSSGS